MRANPVDLLSTALPGGQGADSVLVEVAQGVGLGAMFSVPVALIGGVLGARMGPELERWHHSAMGAVGRVPSLLTALLLGLWGISMGIRESGQYWGVVATVAGLPVIWRIVSGALSELPTGMLESAAALGLARPRILWLAGLPVVGPSFLGAVLLGFARALTAGWAVFVLRVDIERLAWGALGELAGVVTLVTLCGSFLLSLGRRRSRGLERAAS